MNDSNSSIDEVSKVVHKNGIYSIELSGTSYEMGRKHGRLLRDQIIASVADYKANIVKLYGQEDASRIMDWVIHKANFKSSIEAHIPQINNFSVEIDDREQYLA